MLGQEKFHARVVQVLRDSRVFGTLDEAVLQDLAQGLEQHEVRGGAQVFAEGAAADSMFFVVTGRLRVSRREADGGVLRYNEIRPGESVGEMGMILHQSRTADVSAVRDSSVAVMDRAHFEALLQRHPIAINRVFAQVMFEHLRHTSQVLQRHQAQSFVVLPLTEGADAAEVARGLVEAFGKLGRVHHTTPAAESQRLAHTQAPGSDAAHFDALEDQFDYLVYETDASASPWTLQAFRQADQVVFVAAAGSPLQPTALEQRLAEEPGFSLKRQHLVLLHAATAGLPEPTARWRNGRQIERVYPLRHRHGGDFARLARFLTGRAVGVVLGGGGARGFAHLGVLRALQQSNIPVDLVGGNSMGALIGAQYASGLPLERIQAQTRKFAEGGEWPTLPIISLVSGRRVSRDLQRMFGETQVDGLWTPYFAAACNLTKACTTVQESGPLWRAVLASNSPAGLFPPVLYQGDLLVDGAILENVPVEAMRMRLGTPLEKRRGNGTIIAIDVDVREELGVDPCLQRLSVRRKLKSYVTRNSQSAPGIAEILYRAGHIGGLNRRAATIAQAEHYLEPPVAAFPLMAYRRADEIAEIGYRHAMEKIATWTL
ncbi:patatin-like phospholipase family protein [Rhodoferax sp.]|uniref:cyclic nucleotide-binding and patatin-like phospholipase domain-containing protein n=1 Tax=Rhodoferax sp. TaxID=50421 RepID=UPI00374DAFC4